MNIENLMTGADTYVPLAEVTNAHSVDTPDGTPVYTVALVSGTLFGVSVAGTAHWSC